MTARNNAALAIFLLGAFTLFGSPIAERLGLELNPVFQMMAGLAVLVLLWHETRGQKSGWRLLAWIGAAMVLLYGIVLVLAVMAFGPWAGRWWF